MRRRARWAMLPVVVVVAVVGAGGCARVAEPPLVPPGSTRSSTGPGLEEVMSVGFDELDAARDGTLLDDGTGRVLGAKVRVPGDAPGALAVLEGRDDGSALQFPAPCAEATCPRAIVEVMDDDDLVPGERDFLLSTVLRMSPDETSVGSNVAQKGFSTGGGGQWKLQVDGAEGLPTCVLVGSVATASDAAPGRRHVARARTAVSDGRWHDVGCRRQGDVLSVLVDGQVSGRTALPAGLDVRPPGPVRLGGKNVRQDNDQFLGALDEVDLFLGPEAPVGG